MVNYQQEGLTDELPMSHEWERRWTKFFSEQLYLLATGAYTSERAIIDRLSSIEVIPYEQMAECAGFAAPGAEASNLIDIIQMLAVAPAIEMYIMPHRAFVLVGLLQFVLRHPDLNSQVPSVSAVGHEMAQNLISRLGEIHPTIAAALNQGWDERLDMTAEEFADFSALHNYPGSIGSIIINDDGDADWREPREGDDNWYPPDNWRTPREGEDSLPA